MEQKLNSYYKENITWVDLLNEEIDTASKTKLTRLLEDVSVIQERLELNLLKPGVMLHKEKENEVPVQVSGRGLNNIGLRTFTGCRCYYCRLNKSAYQRLFRFIYGRGNYSPYISGRYD